VAHPAQEKPDDYVIATNETHSVREFLELAFDRQLDWQNTRTGQKVYRPAEWTADWDYSRPRNSWVGAKPDSPIWSN